MAEPRDGTLLSLEEEMRTQALTWMHCAVPAPREVSRLQQDKSCMIASVRYLEEPNSQTQKVDGGCQGWGKREMS